MMEDLSGAKAIETGAMIGADSFRELQNASVDALMSLARIMSSISQSTADPRVRAGTRSARRERTADQGPCRRRHGGAPR